MPYRRRYTSRRIRRPRRYVRRSRLPRRLPYRPKKRITKIHSFKRTFMTTHTLATAATTANCWGFTLNMLNNYTEFTSLFDQYRLKAVSFTVIPRFTEISSSTPVDVGFYSVIDRNDQTNLASVAAACEYENMKRTRLNQFHKRYLKLSTLVDTGIVGSSAVCSTKFSPWLSTANADITHLGIKTIADATGIGSPLVCDIKMTVYFQCKVTK